MLPSAMPVLQIARASSSGSGVRPLISPYVSEANDLIQPGEDFTVLLTHISRSLLQNYRGVMKAGEHGNHHFVVISQFGIGSNGGQMPSKTINHIQPVDSIKADIHSFWGEKIHWVEDYRDTGRDGQAGRVFIAVSAFCQNLGNDSAESSIRRVAARVVGAVGRFVPGVSSAFAVAGPAMVGLASIAKKMLEIQKEVKTSTITLYPGSRGELLPGDAYLQRGSYVLFFEETEIDDYQLLPSGQVEPIAGRGAADPPAYVVVNIVNELIDASSSAMVDKSVALDILEAHYQRYGLAGVMDQAPGGGGLVDGLEKLGGAYRLKAHLVRFEELSARKDLLASEQQRLRTLRRQLSAHLEALAANR